MMNTNFATRLNLSRQEIRALETLTPRQISEINRNVRVSTDQEAIDAAAQYMADGGEIADLLAWRAVVKDCLTTAPASCFSPSNEAGKQEVLSTDEGSIARSARTNN